jgi:hypothetical protein
MGDKKVKRFHFSEIIGRLIYASDRDIPSWDWQLGYGENPKGVPWHGGNLALALEPRPSHCARLPPHLTWCLDSRISRVSASRKPGNRRRNSCIGAKWPTRSEIECGDLPLPLAQATKMSNNFTSVKLLADYHICERP